MVSLLETSAWQTPLLESKRQRAPDWDTEDAVAFKQLPPEIPRGDRLVRNPDPRHHRSGSRCGRGEQVLIVFYILKLFSKI